MGTIVCQVCEGTIGHFEDEKSTVLYGNVDLIATVTIKNIQSLNKKRLHM